MEKDFSPFGGFKISKEKFKIQKSLLRLSAEGISSTAYIIGIVVIIISIVLAYIKEYYQSTKKISLNLIQQHIIYQTMAIFCLEVLALLLALSIPSSYQFMVLLSMSGLRILLERKVQHKFLVD